MAEAKIQKKSNILVGLGVILLIIAGFFYFRSRRAEPPKPTTFEEIITQEEGAVRKSGEEVEAMSEEEIAQLKEEVDGVLATAGAEINLTDVIGTGAMAEAQRAFSDGKFYYKLTASGLRLPEKGYFYEGWLKKGDDYLSVGRIEVDLMGKGSLYYSASVDRSDYNQAMITLEPEDGNEAPARVVLEGEF